MQIEKTIQLGVIRIWENGIHIDIISLISW